MIADYHDAVQYTKLHEKFLYLAVALPFLTFLFLLSHPQPNFMVYGSTFTLLIAAMVFAMIGLGRLSAYLRFVAVNGFDPDTLTYPLVKGQGSFDPSRPSRRKFNIMVLCINLSFSFLLVAFILAALNASFR